MNAYQAGKLKDLVTWLDLHGYSTTIKEVADGQKEVQFRIFIRIPKIG